MLRFVGLQSQTRLSDCTELNHQVMSNSSVTPWTVALWTPPSMGFPRQEYWSELPFASPEDLLAQESISYLLNWQADSLPLSYQSQK